MANIVITGCNSGLGREIVGALFRSKGSYLYGLDLNVSRDNPVDEFYQTDLQQPMMISNTAAQISKRGPVDILIHCAGINAIDYLEDLTQATWDNVMDVNARALFLLAKHFLPALKVSKGTILNIISNASHTPMTASLAYNASKGAAHIMTLQLARELTRRHGITVFGISPNKMAGTGMSRYIEGRVPEVRGWTREEADAYQQASLLAGEETDPATLARFIAYLLSSKQNHRFLTGCVIPYGC